MNWKITQSEKCPVRLQSLKLLGALVFSVESLFFSHLEIVTAALAIASQEQEVQVARHAGRVLETISGKLTISCPENFSMTTFWNIIFPPITALAQHSQMVLREMSCDCLGTIGSTMFSELPVSFSFFECFNFIIFNLRFFYLFFKFSEFLIFLIFGLFNYPTLRIFEFWTVGSF